VTKSTSSEFSRAGVFLLPVTALVLVATGCDSANPSRPNLPTAESVVRERAIQDGDWIMLWSRGGDESERSLLSPFRMVVDSDNVYVLDRLNHNITAFRLADGEIEWSRGRHGGGPGEFTDPQGISVGSSGRILVLDRGNARISLFTRSGHLDAEIPIGEPFAQQACEVGDGSLLMARGGFSSPLLRLSPDGKDLGEVVLPWPEVSLAHPLQVQGELASAPGGSGCVFAMSLGWGFASFDDSGVVSARYVESHGLPTVQYQPSPRGAPPSVLLNNPTENGALGVSIVGGELTLGFGGQSPDKFRLLDVYDIATGEYLLSRRAPQSFQRAQRAGDVYLFLGRTSQHYPVLTAWRWEPIGS
jgi:hypothetical protein